MKLVLYEQADRGVARAGALVDGGVADLMPALAGLEGGGGQRLTENVIDAFDERRSEIERIIAAGPTAPLDGVRLLPPAAAAGQDTLLHRQLLGARAT